LKRLEVRARRTIGDSLSKSIVFQAAQLKFRLAKNLYCVQNRTTVPSCGRIVGDTEVWLEGLSRRNVRIAGHPTRMMLDVLF
jgi:hypothetical protein